MDLNTSWEPMDVDLSSNSVSAMDVSYDEQINYIKEEGKEKTDDFKMNSKPPQSIVFKKLEVDLKPKNLKPRNGYFYYTCGVIALLLSGVIYQFNVNFKCNSNLNIDLITYKFSKRLYGQEQAMSKVLKTLESDMKNKMLILFGQSGVGKTLTVSLIFEDLLAFNNVYHYTMPTLVDMFTADLFLGLTLCDNSIFVVDDIKSNDTVQVKEIVKTLVSKSKNLNKNLTIILVYNCGLLNKQFLSICESSFNTDLMMSFNDIDIYKEYIEFKSLDENTLRKCIEYELGNKKVSKDLLKNILKNFNVSQDGCKGVHQKMKYLNII